MWQGWCHWWDGQAGDICCQNSGLPLVIQPKGLEELLEVWCCYLIGEACLILVLHDESELDPLHHIEWYERLGRQLGLKLGSACFPRGGKGVEFGGEMVGRTSRQVCKSTQ